MKLKKNNKFVVAADGSAASGKTTGAKIISKKYGLKFLLGGVTQTILLTPAIFAGTAIIIKDEG